MRRLVTDHQPFNGRIVTTASPEVLVELAEVLAREEIATAHRLVAEFGNLLGLRLEKRFEALFDFRGETPFQVALPEGTLPRVADAARKLAGRPDHSEAILSDVLDLPEAPELDWVLRVEAGRSDPERDYVPEGMGGMWDAVLYHPIPPEETWLEIWRQISGWSSLEGQSEGGLFVDRSDGERAGGIISPHEAFSSLHDDPPATRAIGYVATPFHTWYGESHDWLQAWFEREHLQLIVHDRHAATGCIAWDLENFFAYRDLIARLSGPLEVSRVIWGLEADSLPVEEATEVAALGELEHLWRTFNELHPRTIEEEAFAAFARAHPLPDR